MSYLGFTVIDADSHFREYLDVDRTYRDNIDSEYRESFEKLSAAVARRREAGQSTDLFMGPTAIIEPSDEWHPLGVYDTFGAEQPTQARMTRQTPIARAVNWQPGTVGSQLPVSLHGSRCLIPSNYCIFTFTVVIDCEL